MTTTFRNLLLASAVLGTTGGTVEAATLIGLTADNRLVRIDSETRRATAPVAIRGADGAVIGIDQRPADGRLYGLTANNQLVTIDPMSGQATQVSRLSEPFMGGARVTVDFNPAADRLRVMGSNGTSFRINVETGAVAKDGSHKYQAGTPFAETQPRIVAGAYSNSVAGTTATALYTLDTLLRSYNVQMPPNDGVQVVRGQLPATLPTGVAFDILTVGTTNTGYLLAAGTLHTLSIDNGALTPLGTVANLPASEIVDIAAMR
jgi:hypothetical protein